MTDPTTPEQIAAAPAPIYPPAYSQPAPPVAPGYSPAPVAPKRGLSLTSFILGIAGLVLSFVFGLGLLVAVAAVIVGFLGRKREPGAPKWMSLVGIIGGFVGVVVALIAGGIFIFIIVANAAAGDASGNF